jgi:hypothetical protein
VKGTAAILNNIPIVSAIPMGNQIGNSAERDKSLMSQQNYQCTVNQTYSK